MNGFRLPSTPDLRTSIAHILQSQDGLRGSIAKLERRPNVYQSSFPSEVVTCLDAGGKLRRFLLKYNTTSPHDGHGYWGNVKYESKVYRDVLGEMRISLPRWFGYLRVENSGQECMMLEYIGDGMRLTHSPPAALVRSAAWLGKFHAIGDRSRDRLSGVFPTRYGKEYFLGWSRRSLRFAAQYAEQPLWLKTLVKRFAGLLDILVTGPTTVIHGEFYPKNILVAKRGIYPVDWQSAALARGEIDFASLTEGWSDERIVRRCEDAYLKARWPGGPPADYRAALALARIYWPLRWLGDKPEWTIVRKRSWWVSLLRSEGERAGLL